MLRELIANEVRLEADTGGFTDPNKRTIKLKLGDKTISSVTIDVVQRREYGG